MTDSELFPFMDAFRGLQRVFPKRLDEHDLQQMGSAYFKALRKFPLGRVQAGADAWVQRGKFFPKPAEWIDAIPQAKPASADIPSMTEAQAEDYRRAERLRYEDAPCGCQACRAAEVHEKPLRFVPTLDANDNTTRMREGERIVTAGHWAHGVELARWYHARADFCDAFLKIYGMRKDKLAEAMG